MLVQQTSSGPKLVMPQRSIAAALPSGAATNSASGSQGLQIVQTSLGQYLLTSSVQKPSVPAASSVVNNPTVALLQRLQGLKGLQGSVITTGAGGRPVLRLPSTSFKPNMQQVTI